MPGAYRTKKEREAFLIGEFLNELGYQISDPDWDEKRERPDSFVTISKEGGSKRVGVELIDYHNNTIAGKASPLSAVAEFWQKVQDCLVVEIDQQKHLTGVQGAVTLHQDIGVFKVPAPEIAGELIELALATPVEVGNRSTLDFEAYPKLREMVKSITLSRWTEEIVPASHCSWTCTNIVTGCVGLSIEYVRSAVRKKNKKVDGYDRDGAEELWLLIAAAGDTLDKHAGPFSQSPALSDGELKALCNESSFDRIVFWERIRCWYKWLKPVRSAVQYRAPYMEEHGL